MLKIFRVRYLSIFFLCLSLQLAAQAPPPPGPLSTVMAANFVVIPQLRNISPQDATAHFEDSALYKTRKISSVREYVNGRLTSSSFYDAQGRLVKNSTPTDVYDTSAHCITSRNYIAGLPPEETRILVAHEKIKFRSETCTNSDGTRIETQVFHNPEQGRKDSTLLFYVKDTLVYQRKYFTRPDDGLIFLEKSYYPDGKLRLLRQVYNGETLSLQYDKAGTLRCKETSGTNYRNTTSYNELGQASYSSFLSYGVCSDSTVYTYTKQHRLLSRKQFISPQGKLLDDSNAILLETCSYDEKGRLLQDESFSSQTDTVISRLRYAANGGKDSLSIQKDFRGGFRKEIYQYTADRCVQTSYKLDSCVFLSEALKREHDFLPQEERTFLRAAKPLLLSVRVFRAGAWKEAFAAVYDTEGKLLSATENTSLIEDEYWPVAVYHAACIYNADGKRISCRVLSEEGKLVAEEQAAYTEQGQLQTFRGAYSFYGEAATTFMSDSFAYNAEGKIICYQSLTRTDTSQTNVRYQNGIPMEVSALQNGKMRWNWSLVLENGLPVKAVIESAHSPYDTPEKQVLTWEYGYFN